MSTETITHAGRTMTFFEGNAAHYLGGESDIMVAHAGLRPGDVFFDVGAAHSAWTLFGLASGATVYAFEPSDRWHAELVAEVALNDGFSGRAKLLRLGLDDAKHGGTLKGWYDECGSAGVEMTPDCLVPAEFVTMDSYLPELSRLDLVKVDVEGGELRVLRGGVECLRKFHPKLVVENHIDVDKIGPWMRATGMLGKLYAMLAELGYTTVEVPHQGRSFIIAS